MVVLGFIAFVFSCRTSKDSTSTEVPDWWETETVDTGETNNEGDDKDSGVYDKDTSEEEKDSASEDVPECGEDFNQDAPCVGDWTTTLCMHDGILWWCEHNVWLNQEDK